MPRTRDARRVQLHPSVRFKILEDCGFVCAHCGKKLSYVRDYTVEHVVPLNKGGTNDPDNLIALCEACNKEKGDDVVCPDDYYHYLPKPVRERAIRTFDRYVKSVSWLDERTVFMADRFTMPVDRYLPGRRNVEPKKIRSSCRVEKIHGADSLIAILTEYAARLAPDDKPLVPLRPDAMRPAYYGVHVGSVLACVVCPYLELSGVPTMAVEEPEEDRLRPILYLDVFAQYIENPPLCAVFNMKSVLESLIREVRRTLSSLPGPSAVEVLIRTPESDPLANNAIKALAGRNWGFWKSACQECDPDLAATPRMHIGDAIVLASGPARLFREDGSMDDASPEAAAALAALQDPVTREMSIAPPARAPDRRTKSQRKKGKAHKKYRK